MPAKLLTFSDIFSRIMTYTWLDRGVEEAMSGVTTEKANGVKKTEIGVEFATIKRSCSYR